MDELHEYTIRLTDTGARLLVAVLTAARKRRRREGDRRWLQHVIDELQAGIEQGEVLVAALEAAPVAP